MDAQGPGWGTDPFPPIYQEADARAAALREKSRVIGDAAWKLDSALRAVRLAGSPEAKEKALANLSVALAGTLPPLRNDELLE